MLFAVLASVFLVRDIRKKKVDDAFYVMVIDLNLPGDVVETMEEELSEVLGLEPGIQQCRIEAGYSSGANMQSEATISTYMRSGRVDLVIAPEEVFNRYKTVPVDLLTFVGEHGTDYGYLCAGVLISVIPVMAVYLIFQRYFVEGMAGAVK